MMGIRCVSLYRREYVVDVYWMCLFVKERIISEGNVKIL